MHASVRWLALTVLIGLSVGCGGQTTSDADLTVIEMDELVEQMADDDTLVVDVRSPRRYATGHLPGAVNIPFAEIRGGDPRLRAADLIVVYAGGWTDPLAKPASKRLIDLGYGPVRTFLGGAELWIDSGRRLIESSQPTRGRPETAG